MTVKQRAVFLDRDGVINRVVYRDGNPASPRGLAEFEFEPGVVECVARLAVDFPVFVFTNQPDVARGLLDMSVLEAMHDNIRKLPVRQIVACTHDDRDGCDCRKPKPGMLTKLAAAWVIDLSQSVVVGDSWRDIAAGRAAGCRTILLRRPYNDGVDADHSVPTLADATDLIMSGGIYGPR